jgi:hypothetical protein
MRELVAEVAGRQFPAAFQRGEGTQRRRAARGLGASSPSRERRRFDRLAAFADRAPQAVAGVAVPTHVQVQCLEEGRWILPFLPQRLRIGDDGAGRIPGLTPLRLYAFTWLAGGTLLGRLARRLCWSFHWDHARNSSSAAARRAKGPFPLALARGFRQPLSRLAFARAGEQPAVTLGPAAFAAPSGATPAGRLWAPPAARRRLPPAPCAGSCAGFIVMSARPAGAQDLGLRPRRTSDRLPPSFGRAPPRRQIVPRRPAAGSPRSRPSVCTPGLADGQGRRRALRLRPAPRRQT